MKTISAFIERHLLPTYFTLTFALSWGGLLLLIGGPGAILGTSERTDPYVYLAMLVGPAVAGILPAGLVHGRAGLCDLLTRLTRWRVSARWYAVALLTAPLLVTATSFALSLTLPESLPGIVASDEKATLLLSGIAAGLMVGIFEELGWTGFAIPRLLARHGVLGTGLIVGVLWGAWHLPLFSGSGGSSGVLPLALLLPVQLFSFLPAYRVIMVWI